MNRLNLRNNRLKFKTTRELLNLQKNIPQMNKEKPEDVNMYIIGWI